MSLFLLAAALSGTAAAGEGAGGEANLAGLSDAELVRHVDERVAQWRITDEDRRFDETGWSTSILEAQRLAREHDRPVFLFTHDGRMAIGRC